MSKQQAQASSASKSETKVLPVTILSGFLGAGKTTMLNYILKQPHGYRIAVIVNDMSEVLVDAKLVQHQKRNQKMQQPQVSRVQEKLVQMPNGCICCTLREDLLQEVRKLAESNQFDYLLIESTGISEPMPVAETFTFEVNETTNAAQQQQQQKQAVPQTLKDIARLDTMVTVIDSYNFLMDFTSNERLKDRKMEADKADERSIVDLLVDQVEFANVIILNKVCACLIVLVVFLFVFEALLNSHV